MATQFRVLFLHSPNGAQQPPKTIQRRSKRYPLETISYDFGAPGGNVKTMVSFTRNDRFHGWSGSPETPEAFKKALRKNIRNKYRKNTKNTEKCPQSDPKGMPKGGQRTNIFVTFSAWRLNGCPGEPHGRQKTPTDTKRVPK